MDNQNGINETSRDYIIKPIIDSIEEGLEGSSKEQKKELINEAIDDIVQEGHKCEILSKAIHAPETIPGWFGDVKKDNYYKELSNQLDQYMQNNEISNDNTKEKINRSIYLKSYPLETGEDVWKRRQLGQRVVDGIQDAMQQIMTSLEEQGSDTEELDQNDAQQQINQQLTNGLSNAVQQVIGSMQDQGNDNEPDLQSVNSEYSELASNRSGYSSGNESSEMEIDDDDLEIIETARQARSRRNTRRSNAEEERNTSSDEESLDSAMSPSSNSLSSQGSRANTPNADNRNTTQQYTITTRQRTRIARTQNSEEISHTQRVRYSLRSRRGSEGNENDNEQYRSNNSSSRSV